MTIKYKGKDWEAKYEADDPAEHIFNVWLEDGDGNTVESDEMPESIRHQLEAWADEDYISSLPDFLEYQMEDR